MFSAHLHMDEATPHIHIDFVPFVTGSKRGLDTRVSLKQALAAQGFTGGSRGATEWNQWVQSEKEQLAKVMERHGFTWERLGTHEEHLSVIDYKKQERTKELAAVEEKLADRESDLQTMVRRIGDIEKGVNVYQDLAKGLDSDPEYQLPEPNGLMSARTYKAKFAEPLIQKLKDRARSLLTGFIKLQDRYHRLNRQYGELYQENEYLERENNELREENTILRERYKDHALLRKVFGDRKIDELVKSAEEIQQARRGQCVKAYER